MRHGCRLVLLIVGISVLAIFVVGTFGLIGPRELSVIIATVAGGVIVRDRSKRRRAARAER